MNTFYKNYVNLCVKHGMSKSGAAEAIGLSNAAATGWKNGKIPSATTQVKLSNLFGVSVEELMGDGPSSGIKKDPIREDGAVSPAAQEILDFLDSASGEELADVIKYIRYLKSQRK